MGQFSRALSITAFALVNKWGGQYEVKLLDGDGALLPLREAANSRQFMGVEIIFPTGRSVRVALFKQGEIGSLMME